MLTLVPSIVLVLCALFPLNVSASELRFAKFSGAYDRTCVGMWCFNPWFCGHELFLRIIDTQLTNLTIDGTEYGGKHHCDVRNLSMSLIDVNKTYNHSVNDRRFMIVPKEGTSIVCGEEKLGIILKQKPDGVRYVSLIANVDHVYSTGRFGPLRGYYFDSLKLSDTMCEYKGRPANWVRASSNELRWSVVKRIIITVVSFPIICVVSIFIRAGLESYGHSTAAHNREKFFLFTIYPVYLLFLSLFEELFPPILNGRYERSISKIPPILLGSFVALLAAFSSLAGVFHSIRASLIWYKSRVESNTADLAVGWIIGIGAALASLPFFGPLGAMALGLAVAEITAQTVIRSRRLLTVLGQNDASHI